MELLLTVVIYLVIGGALFYAVWWFLGYIALPEPFNKIARLIVALAALLFVFYLLMGLMPAPVRIR